MERIAVVFKKDFYLLIGVSRPKIGSFLTVCPVGAWPLVTQITVPDRKCGP
jgi:hypothetical protein